MEIRICHLINNAPQAVCIHKNSDEFAFFVWSIGNETIKKHDQIYNNFNWNDNLWETSCEYQ